MRAQVVLLDGDRILMARHERAGHSYWVLPGGSVDPGERPEDAAVREVLEETGLTIDLVGLLFIEQPRRCGEVVIKHPRYTYLARVGGGVLSQLPDPSGGTIEKGFLAGAAWLPLDSREFDAATRETLRLVREALPRLDDG